MCQKSKTNFDPAPWKGQIFYRFYLAAQKNFPAKSLFEKVDFEKNECGDNLQVQ